MGKNALLCESARQTAGALIFVRGTARCTRNQSRSERAMARRASRILTVILGVLGELMITAGLLIGGYLAWDLWWDSNASTAIANEHVAEFEQAIVAAPRVAGTVVTEGEPPPAKEEGKIAIEGDTIGILIVPKWYGLTENKMPIRSGISDGVLNQAAAGHYPYTAMPGEVGNFSVAAHRRTHGNSFRFINKLVPGDQVIVETADTWYIYEVTSYDIVLPDQVEVIAPVPGHPGEVPVDRMLTMTTCHSPTTGEWGNSHRWVTHAKLVGWMDRADGMPEQVLTDPGVK